MEHLRGVSEERSGLLIEDLRVTFGGHVAVDDVGISVPVGKITGLIGPNGAGKTTTFNACTGVLRPDRGRVSIDGSDITKLRVSARARRGLGRTFQIMELFNSLTVGENVALGREASMAGSGILSQIYCRPAQRDEIRAAAEEAMTLCGILDLSNERAGGLSTGQRRLVDLARVLAGPFHILLLDEPSSGLDSGETRAFAEVLKAVIRNGIGILLVEHDMDLVMDVANYIYVLDFGKLIYEGVRSEVLASQRVRDVYLGSGVI